MNHENPPPFAGVHSNLLLYMHDAHCLTAPGLSKDVHLKRRPKPEPQDLENIASCENLRGICQCDLAPGHDEFDSAPWLQNETVAEEQHVGLGFMVGFGLKR